MFHAKNEALQKHSLLEAKLNYIFIFDLQKNIYKKVPKAHLYPIFLSIRAQKRCAPGREMVLLGHNLEENSVPFWDSC